MWRFFGVLSLLLLPCAVDANWDWVGECPEDEVCVIFYANPCARAGIERIEPAGIIWDEATTCKGEHGLTGRLLWGRLDFKVTDPYTWTILAYLSKTEVADNRFEFKNWDEGMPALMFSGKIDDATAIFSWEGKRKEIKAEYVGEYDWKNERLIIMGVAGFFIWRHFERKDAKTALTRAIVLILLALPQSNGIICRSSDTMLDTECSANSQCETIRTEIYNKVSYEYRCSKRSAVLTSTMCFEERRVEVEEEGVMRSAFQLICICKGDLCNRNNDLSEKQAELYTEIRRKVFESETKMRACNPCVEVTTTSKIQQESEPNFSIIQIVGATIGSFAAGILIMLGSIFAFVMFIRKRIEKKLEYSTNPYSRLEEGCSSPLLIATQTHSDDMVTVDSIDMTPTTRRASLKASETNRETNREGAGRCSLPPSAMSAVYDEETRRVIDVRSLQEVVSEMDTKMSVDRAYDQLMDADHDVSFILARDPSKEDEVASGAPSYMTVIDNYPSAAATEAVEPAANGFDAKISVNREGTERCQLNLQADIVNGDIRTFRINGVTFSV